ncbi:MAG: PQQ-dependent sugar dehydrogenase [Chitinophagaceae bacterium]|nr:PQQ-dependent sugar dehydrogenase [Chitinophagaceae bacterium]
MMKKRILIGLAGAWLQIFLFTGCNSGVSLNDDSISTDADTIAAGEILFNQSCSDCHNFRQDGIGPQLSGLTGTVSAEWIHGFIKHPQQLISSGDERALQLLSKYKVVMPSFTSLTDKDVNAIIAFLHTHKVSPQVAKGNQKQILNPIPDSIKLSGLVVNLELVAQIPASSDSGKTPLARITKLGLQPGSNDLFILDLRGRLYKLNGNKSTVYMDMAALKPVFINRPGLGTGFGSFAFHPGFAKNGILYTSHTEATGSGKPDFYYEDSIKVAMQWVVSEWKTEDPGAKEFSGKSRELFRVNMVTGAHGVQEITFNPRSKMGDQDYGLLYIGIGDGASVEKGYPFLVHSTKKIWGTIIRIDPMGSNSRNGRYGIPASNPFANDPNALGEIYAYGFRNPHRITWTNSGKMLSCNIGHGNIESINLVFPGHDYGWPVREGHFVVDTYGDLNKVYPLPANDSSYNISYPVAAYDHDEGKAISGGFEYLGEAIPLLKGKYLFGDIPTGRLFYIELADLKEGKLATVKEWQISIKDTPHTFKDLHQRQRVDLHFGRDTQGELYILTKCDGKVYRFGKATMKN